MEWKECPEYVDKDHRYLLDKESSQKAIHEESNHCIITGKNPLPSCAVSSWLIEVDKPSGSIRKRFLIGVAPFDVNQNEVGPDYYKSGWYYDCLNGTLKSGPPHNYGPLYEPRKKFEKYDSEKWEFGVVMDTAKGELSFIMDEMDCGVAYRGIPLDRPLVPCVIFMDDTKDFSVRITAKDLKVKPYSKSAPVPQNVTVESTTWSTITLKWDWVSNPKAYQIEYGDDKMYDIVDKCETTLLGLEPASVYNIRVRTVTNDSVSAWSSPVKEFTKKMYTDDRHWEKCPHYYFFLRRYSLDKKNSKIAIRDKMDDPYIGLVLWNTPFMSDTINSCGIKVVKSKKNCKNIYVGVVPFDVCPNNESFSEVGWFIYCYWSTLLSGPPHNYKWPGKEYGPRKKEGKYVRNGDTVGIVMDTKKGELSFVVDGVNLGVAYDGIPLDKPLVPCAGFCEGGESVEFIEKLK